jgi:hypothetical protein
MLGTSLTDAGIFITHGKQQSTTGQWFPHISMGVLNLSDMRNQTTKACMPNQG